MISTIEKDLENVVGGKIKAKHVVGIVCGVVGAAILVVGGKFIYDVATVGDLVPVDDEHAEKTRERIKKASKAEIIWDRAVGSTADFLQIGL